ncbi:MAG: hypothetical protein EA398_13630 [Deltaproteobacteria bacterium]|nr:MAG: hypothetical protein EA398_13630 [Deltaproteobacteria bacterium]
MNCPARLALIPIGSLLLLTVGCSDDFGTACELPDTPAIQQQCTTSEGEQSRPTCVFELSPECNSNICAVYEGSRPFCSVPCQASSDCPGDAFCDEADSGTRYCVPADLRL